MQLSFITKYNKQVGPAVVRAATNMGYEAESFDLSYDQDLKMKLSKTGNLVFWHSASLRSHKIRQEISIMLKNKRVINRSILDNGYRIRSKRYQQRLIKSHPTIKGIDTYRFYKIDKAAEAIKEGRITYPFIMKPIKGEKGKEVFLIHSLEEIEKNLTKEIKRYIFQPYIRNDGDYRVIVLGGRAVGSIKRVAEEGKIVNNISAGGHSYAVEEAIKSEIEKMAIELARFFQLDYCGLDIIYDKKEGKFLFLEINSGAGWPGFKGPTGVDVPTEIATYCKNLLKSC